MLSEKISESGIWSSQILVGKAPSTLTNSFREPEIRKLHDLPVCLNKCDWRKSIKRNEKASQTFSTTVFIPEGPETLACVHADAKSFGYRNRRGYKVSASSVAIFCKRCVNGG